MVLVLKSSKPIVISTLKICCPSWKLAVERLTKKQKDYKELQVGYLAINKIGEYVAYSLQ